MSVISVTSDIGIMSKVLMKSSMNITRDKGGCFNVMSVVSVASAMSSMMSVINVIVIFVLSAL